MHAKSPTFRAAKLKGFTVIIEVFALLCVCVCSIFGDCYYCDTPVLRMCVTVKWLRLIVFVRCLLNVWMMVQFLGIELVVKR